MQLFQLLNLVAKLFYDRLRWKKSVFNFTKSVVLYFIFIIWRYFISFLWPSVENHCVKWAICLKNYKICIFIIIGIMIIKCIMLLSILMSTGQGVGLSHESNSQDLQIVSVRSHNQLPGMKSGQMSFFFYTVHCVAFINKYIGAYMEGTALHLHSRHFCYDWWLHNHITVLTIRLMHYFNRFVLTWIVTGILISVPCPLFPYK